MKRANAVLSVSPTYVPVHGLEFMPAHGMWYITPFLSSLSSLSLGLTRFSLREPLVLTVVLRPLALRALDRGSVMPEKYGRATLPRGLLAEEEEEEEEEEVAVELGWAAGVASSEGG